MSETDYQICPKCGKKMISRSVPICQYLGRNYHVLGEPIHPYRQIYYYWCGCGYTSRHRFESVDPEGKAKKRWEELNADSHEFIADPIQETFKIEINRQVGTKMTKYIDAYADELLNYGGLLTRRIDIIRDLQAKGFERKRIGFYLFCLDRNKERRLQ